MRVQLWSYNYDPEPTGIGPMSRILAHGLRDAGHQVEVVAAHPHYPTPLWGRSARPYREVREGIGVVRLPLWIGRATAAERYRQELTFMAAQFAAVPALGTPDILISGSPSFPALLPAIVNARLRRTPWLLWLHDILPDGATATGLLDEGFVLRGAMRLERAAYAAASQVVVPSPAFLPNLVAKGVPAAKLSLIGYPATKVPRPPALRAPRSRSIRLLAMGNIGHSQGMAPLVRAFEAESSFAGADVRFIIVGDGIAADSVRAEIRTDRVEMLGLVDEERLDEELERANVALVSQHHAGTEFNIPSKLMNFMAYGLPVIAAVDRRGEVARLVEDAQAGWVLDSRRPDSFVQLLGQLPARTDEVARRGQAAEAYALTNFAQATFVRRFDALLVSTLTRTSSTRR